MQTPRVLRSRFLWSLIAWTCVAAALRESSAPSTLYTNDILGGSPIGIIIGLVGGLFGIFRGKAPVFVKVALNGLRNGLLDVSRGLANFIGETRAFLAVVLGLLKRFWEHSIRPLVFWLRERIRWLTTWLHKIFDPVLRIIKKLRERILELYQRFVRPVLDVIETVRFILGTLNRLGVEWAGALERRIAKIESAINENFRKLLSKVNEAIDVLEDIRSGEFVFGRVRMLRMVRRDVRDIWRVLVNARTATRPASPGPGPRPIEQIRRDTEEALLTGGGRYSAFIAEQGAIWRRALDSR